MRSNLWKDLKVHIVLLIVSLLVGPVDKVAKRPILW